jgi:glycosyltransferase involved in cell wall biosynthesis
VRILFLNQYFPPDPAPTGVLLRELGDHLAARGDAVEFISAGQEYRSGKRNRRRILRELQALCAILWKSLRAQRADVIFSASSPPCLPAVASVAAWWHGAKSVHWAMDLYPELALALGELKPGIAARAIHKLMEHAYGKADVVVALDEDMAACLEKYGVRADFIRPWISEKSSSEAGENCQPDDGEWTWIYSGNLGRAHEWETLLQAQALIEERQSPFRLCFQGGGPCWSPAQMRAKELGLKHCEWRDYADECDLRASLLRGRVLVATQKPEARGLLWPSKLGLLLSLPRPILWVGPTDGAVARLLRPASRAGIFAPGQAAEIADWLESLRSTGGVGAVTPAEDGRAHRALALQRWESLLAKIRH